MRGQNALELDLGLDLNHDLNQEDSFDLPRPFSEHDCANTSFPIDTSFSPSSSLLGIDGAQAFAFHIRLSRSSSLSTTDGLSLPPDASDADDERDSSAGRRSRRAHRVTAMPLPCTSKKRKYSFEETAEEICGPEPYQGPPFSKVAKSDETVRPPRETKEEESGFSEQRAAPEMPHHPAEELLESGRGREDSEEEVAARDEAEHQRDKIETELRLRQMLMNMAICSAEELDAALEES